MNFKDVIKRVFLYFKRDSKECVALICAVCIMAISFLTASYPAFAAATSWDDVSADAIALKNAYIDYFKSLSSGDFGDVLGSAVDIPISWLKTMSDGALAISPVDDLYYYLKDGVLQYEDNREHRSGGGGGRRRGEATEIKPELPVSTVKQINDYWSEYYKPHENAYQYIWSYQSTNSKSAYPYTLDSDAPLYMSTNGNWGRKDWDSGVYLMVFFCDDNNTHGYYYSSRYCHVYSQKDAGATMANIVFDFYDVASGQLVDSIKNGWMAANFPFLGLNFDVSCSTSTEFLRLFKYSTYANYMSKTSSEWGLFPTKLGNFIASDYSDSNAYLTSLCRSVSFTPSSNTNDDYGLIMSSEPFELYGSQTKIDYNQIPDNYTITINGDTIYDYDITNPDTGDHGTVNYYITNNYTLPENGSKDDTKDDSGSGTVSGNVTVGGKVDVSGKIEIDTKPIDININVNGGGSGSSGSGDVSSSPEGVEFDQDISLNNYYDWMQEQTTGFSGFMKNFFSWLPEPIVIMLCAGFALVILARFLGR